MVHAFIRSKDMVHSKLKSESSRKKILDQLSTFPGLKPNPLLELDFEGNILLANNAALSALQNTGANLDARKLLPKDIAPILENLKNKKRELFVRKVEFGNTCFKETIHFNSQSNSVLVCAKSRPNAIKPEADPPGREQNLQQTRLVPDNGSWNLSVKDNSITWSDSNYRIFGLDRKTPLNLGVFLSTIHPDDKDLVKNSWTEAINGKSYNIEYRVLVKGKIQWVRERAKFNFNRRRALVSGSGTTQIIPENKQAKIKLNLVMKRLRQKIEEQRKKISATKSLLKKSEFNHAKLWNNTPVAMHILDRNGTIIEANKTEAELLGYPIEEMIGRPIFDFIKPNQRKNAQKRFHLKISGKRLAQYENRIYLKKDGTELFVHINDNIERDGKRKIFQIRTTLIDITDRKLAEKMILQKNQAITMLRAITSASIHAKELKSLLKSACNIIVRIGKYRMAWISMPDSDDNNTILPAAQSGFENGLLEKLVATCNETKKRKALCPTRRSFYSGKIQIEKLSVNTDRFSHLWNEEIAKSGIRSAIALPLIARKKTYGTVTIFSTDPSAFTKNEIATLKALSADLAFGISTLVMRQSHNEAKRHLEYSNKLLKLSSRASSKHSYINGVIKQIKNICKCSSVGIRILNKDGLIPYQSSIGFSRSFLETENKLSIKKDRCICIRMIAEKLLERDHSSLTKFGSFFTNNSFDFNEKLPQNERAKYRGKCMEAGYASIAVIPIRSIGKMVGAIHVADRKIGTLSQQKIELLESLTQLIGDALEKFKTEEKLRNSEKKYRDLIENANSIILQFDLKGNTTFINEYAERFFGFRQDDIIGKPVFETIVPKTDSAGRDLEMMIKDIIRNPKKYTDNENENIKKTGERVWIFWHNRPTFNRKGIMTGILSVGNDITERKQREELMLESYKHIGLINRKISSLLEIDHLAEKYPGKRKLLSEHLLRPIVGISGANFGILFEFEGGNNEQLQLLSSTGISEAALKNIRKISLNESKLITTLSQKKSRIHTTSNDPLLEKLDQANKNAKHLLALPLIWENQLRAVIILGFQEKKVFSNQDFEFYDLFSIHASVSLNSANVLK